MSKLIVALLLSIPFVARAELIFVEYEGTISRVDNPHCFCPLEFDVGDAIGGVLTIDSGRAPPDLFDDDPRNSQHTSVVDYGGFPVRSGIDYIAGGGVPGFFANDVVRVADDLEIDAGGVLARRDIFMVMNSSIGEFDRSRIVLEVASPDLDLVSGDGIAQSFTADDPDDLGGSLVLGLIGRTYRAFTFALSRITVTPGRCRAPA
jgi:hypothetical protein